MSFSDQVKNLWRSIVQNPSEAKELLEQLTPEQVIELKRYTSPYNVIVQDEKRWINISMTSIRENFMRHLALLGTTQYLYKAVDEYEPEDIDKSLWEFERKRIRSFLNWQLQYDPLMHVRSMAQENDPETENSERPPIPAQVANSVGIALKSSPAHPIPPADTMHRINGYISTNYEKLVYDTYALTGIPFDMDNAFLASSVHNSEEAATKFRSAHQYDYRTEVYTVDTGRWVFYGPYKENRKRVDFYNKNTQVLEQILKRIEDDQKLGADLMKQQVKVKKAKNLLEFGKDGELFEEYKRVMAGISQPAAPGLTEEENREVERKKEELYVRRRQLEMEMAPDNAIAVKYYVNEDGKSLVEGCFYTKAEIQEETAKRLELEAAEQLDNQDGTNNLIAGSTSAAN